MIRGFRFTNQLANAEVDARIHQEFLNKSDGIFYGMDLNKTNNSITISEGLCEIAGRPVAVVDSETVEISSENLYCLLILEIDLSKESTKDVFSQVTFKVLTSSTSYPTVTQEDINKYIGNNKVYQLEFARFRTGTSGITDFKDTRKFLNINSIYNEIKKEIQNIKDGSIYVLKSDKVILYENEAGTSETVILNDNVNNYEKIEIYTTKGDVKTFKADNGEKTIFSFRGTGESGNLRCFFCNITFNNNKITFGKQYFRDSDGYGQEYIGIKITKVIGYK